jgi:hypothetical protein
MMHVGMAWPFKDPRRLHLIGGLALALAGCAHTGATEPDSQSSEVSARPVLRLLSGDATTIAADGSASEAGRTFPTVVDGTPPMPWVSSAHAFGAKSLAFSVPTDLSGHKQRIEYKIARAEDPDGLHFDNARYTGFAFKLGAAPDPFRGTAIFWQAWQGFPWGPPASLKFAASDAPFRIRLAVRNMTTGPDSSDPDLEIWSDDLIEPDRWYTFLIYVKPRLDGNGEVKLWIDGTRVVDWTGSLGYDPSQVAGALPGLDIKDGVYQPSSNNGHTFYFDQIVVTDSYAAAAAALGW